MRFLVVSKQKYMVPPEVQLALFDGSLAWLKKYKANGKLEHGWGFAGMPAGAGVVNVNSLEELSQISNELPLNAAAEIEIYPLIDIEEQINNAKKALSSMVKK